MNIDITEKQDKIPTIGILGGMGPEATVDLMNKIIIFSKQMNKSCRIVVDCNPTVPNRSAAIAGEGSSPIPVLIEMTRNLIQIGADILVIACNAAHYFHGEIQAEAGDIVVLNIIDEVSKWFSHQNKVGLISVIGASQLVEGLYKKNLQLNGFEVILPDEIVRREIDNIIEKISNNKPKEEVEVALNNLVERRIKSYQCAHLVLGCTEFALFCRNNIKDIIIVDPLWIAARALVQSLII